MNRKAFHLGILFFMILPLTYQPASAQDFNFQATQTAGSGKAAVKINIVDPSEATGDSYRVTFTIDEFGGYFYSVENLNTQMTLVDALSVEETSSTFEGVQISVDIPPAQIDEIHTNVKKYLNNSSTYLTEVRKTSVALTNSSQLHSGANEL